MSESAELSVSVTQQEESLFFVVRPDWLAVSRGVRKHELVQFKGTGGLGCLLVPLEPRGGCRHILCPGNVREGRGGGWWCGALGWFVTTAELDHIDPN